MIKCPKCGETYYAIQCVTRTALYWEPIYKDGKIINSDPNTTTFSCRCLNCGHEFVCEGGNDDGDDGCI